MGCATALALAQTPALANKKIVLFEGSPRKEFQLPKDYSNRVVALNNSSKILFENLNVWQDIEAMRSKKVSGMKVWDYKGLQNLVKKLSSIANSKGFHFIALFQVTFEAEPGQSHFFIVENDVLVNCLAKKLDHFSNVMVRYASSIQNCHYNKEEKHSTLTLKEGDTLTTRLLIGADGASSTVRDSMDQVQFMTRPYHQFGVVGVLELEDSDSNNDFAWQKFLPTGPIAFLPLSKHFSSLVWTLPSAKAEKMVKLESEAFVESLNQSLGPRMPPDMPRVKAVSKLARFPLGIGHATRYCQEGVVLIGDAAHRVHPLAGQGVNLGFGDVECLARVLAENVMSGSAFPQYASLQEYETERQRYNVPMMLGIDFLQKIYGFDNEFVNAARGLGVQIVRSSPVIKHFLSRFAN